MKGWVGWGGVGVGGFAKGDYFHSISESGPKTGERYRVRKPRIGVPGAMHESGCQISYLHDRGKKKFCSSGFFWVKDKAAQIEFERVQFEKSAAPNRRQSSPFHLLALLASKHVIVAL